MQTSANSDNKNNNQSSAQIEPLLSAAGMQTLTEDGLAHFAHAFISTLAAMRTAVQVAEQNTTPRTYATIVRLKGELGAGKTTFTKAVASTLGITEAITSPTFVIEKIYPIAVTGSAAIPTAGLWNKLIHIDAYRLKGGRELEALHWHDMVRDTQALILIEWPELVEDAPGLTLATGATAEIAFEVAHETTRKVSWQIISAAK